MHYYLNEDRSYRPCSLEEWAIQFKELSENDKKHVGNEIVNKK